MTAKEALKALNAYPIPSQVIDAILVKRGVSATAEYSQNLASGDAYRLATADVYKWLAAAPNVSQGGQSYSFDAKARAEFNSAATRIYNDLGTEDDKASVAYGYRGARL